MTTLELAENVALAVLNAAYEQGYGDGHLRGSTENVMQAVLRCLREHDSWFCRLTLTEDNEGLHRDTLEEPYELVQMELWK